MQPHTDCASCSSHFYLALTIWREARGEARPGRVAVGHSILNRVSRPKWWGTTVPEVVTKKWQYSSLTDPHDPQLATWPLPSDPSWVECWIIAGGILDGSIANPVPGADSYHDVSIEAPKWVASARHVATIGRLLFYDVDHDYEVSSPTTTPNT